MRTRDANLRCPLRVRKQKPEILHQSYRGHGNFPQHFAIVKVVVELLGRTVNLDSGKPLDEIVDHVVAPKLSVGHDVEPGHLLILDCGPDRGVVNFVQIVAADPPGEIIRLQPLEPAGHRIAANHRRGKNRKSHQSYSRRVVYRTEVFDPGRYLNGAKCRSYPALSATSRKRAPLTQFTMDPSNLPGP